METHKNCTEIFHIHSLLWANYVFFFAIYTQENKKSIKVWLDMGWYIRQIIAVDKGDCYSYVVGVSMGIYVKLYL